jgi:hypothetical protein
MKKRSAKMPAGLDDTVATRRLWDREGREAFLVRLGRPRRGKVDWECPFWIGSHPRACIQYGYGVDGLQALIQALDGIRASLAERDRLQWKGGKPGDAGIPRFIPLFFGREFAVRIERFLDDEISRFAKAAEERALSRSQANLRPRKMGGRHRLGAASKKTRR